MQGECRGGFPGGSADPELRGVCHQPGPPVRSSVGPMASFGRAPAAASGLPLPRSFRSRTTLHVESCCRHRFGRADRAIVLAGCERIFQRSFQCGHSPIFGTGRGLGKTCLFFSLLALALQFPALPHRKRGHRFALVLPPCGRTYHCATDPTAGPDKFERQEAPPSIVALHDGAGDEIAGRGGGVEPVPAECAGEPAPAIFASTSSAARPKRFRSKAGGHRRRSCNGNWRDVNRSPPRGT